MVQGPARAQRQGQALMPTLTLINVSQFDPWIKLKFLTLTLNRTYLTLTLTILRTSV